MEIPGVSGRKNPVFPPKVQKNSKTELFFPQKSKLFLMHFPHLYCSQISRLILTSFLLDQLKSATVGYSDWLAVCWNFGDIKWFLAFQLVAAGHSASSNQLEGQKQFDVNEIWRNGEPIGIPNSRNNLPEAHGKSDLTLSGRGIGRKKIHKYPWKCFLKKCQIFPKKHIFSRKKKLFLTFLGVVFFIFLFCLFPVR